jgi:hypothetical protein
MKPKQNFGQMLVAIVAEAIGMTAIMLVIAYTVYYKNNRDVTLVQALPNIGILFVISLVVCAAHKLA